MCWPLPCQHQKHWGLDAELALGGAISDLTPSIWDGRVDLFLGLDAGLALGGATLDLTPSYGDGRVDLF